MKYGFLSRRPDQRKEKINPGLTEHLPYLPPSLSRTFNVNAHMLLLTHKRAQIKGGKNMNIRADWSADE